MSIIAIICSKQIPYTLQHVNNLLLSHEGRILQKNSIDMVANYSNYSRRGLNWNGYQNQGGRNNTSNHSRGRGGSYNNNRPRCQLCENIGHIVLKCYYRLDQNFHGSGGINNASSSCGKNSNQVQNSVNVAQTREELSLKNAPL